MKQVTFVRAYNGAFTTKVDFVPRVGECVSLPEGICMVTKVIWFLDGRLVVHVGRASRPA